MLELPESANIARQLNQLLQGRIIEHVVAAEVPHKFAFYHDDPSKYPELLRDSAITDIKAIGGYVEIQLKDHYIILGEDLALRYLPVGEKPPARHQLLLHFNDRTALAATVKMYGALYVIPAGKYATPHHQAANDKPSPLSAQFDTSYFASLTHGLKSSASIKAFLATEQRIPGLGNGVLQDILFNAKINPKAKLTSLSDTKMEMLYTSVKNTLIVMTNQNGRDTEKDIHGNPGNYATILSSKTWPAACVGCGGAISKQAYMGGTIYYCPVCQAI